MAATEPPPLNLAVTMILRLDPDAPLAAGLDWRAWEELGADAEGVKRYPGGDAGQYFAEHVERVLFPASAELDPDGSRAAAVPRGHRVEIHRMATRKRPETVIALDVDLAEVWSLTVGELHLRFAAIHLAARGAFLAPRNPDPAEEVAAIKRCVYALGASRTPNEFEITIDGERAPGPAASLAGAFGAKLHPHWEDRRAVHAVLGGGFGEAAELPDSARQLAGLTSIGVLEAFGASSQALTVGPFEAAVAPDGIALLKASAGVPEASLLNLRSYWAEALLLGLAQLESMRDLNLRVAERGRDPAGAEIAAVYADWLVFRNLLWWSSPGLVRSPPRRLLAAFRAATGAEDNFRELEGDLDAYVSESRLRVSEAQRRALDNLQIYGAALAVVAALTAVAQVVLGGGAGTAVLVVLVVVILAIGGAAALWVSRRLEIEEA